MMEENQDIFESEGKHEAFLQSLFEFNDEPLEGVEARDYQTAIARKVVEDMKAGKRVGHGVLGTGGGKTTIAKTLIGKLKGKFLYIGPSKASRNQGEKEFKKRKIDKTSQRFINGKFDPAVEVTYSTWQAMVYDGRYKDIDPSHFDLIIFDEGHNFLGEEVSGISRHFEAHQLFVTATPGNSRASLYSVAPHRFFEYSSDELIKNNGYPVWRVYRHEVQDEHLEDAKMIGDEYKLEDGEDKKVLNLPHRFSIAYRLFKESVLKGEKRIAFMPSVGSSKEFIEKVIDKDLDLAGKVVHVDGSMKNVDEIKERFEKGEILGVCCKDLWNESLDVPDIAAVTLVDPTCSARVILQRIGRGARPAPGKTHLRIDDVVSSIPNMKYATAMQNKRPLTVHGLLGRKKYVEGAPVNGPDADLLYRDATVSNAVEIPIHERVFTLDISFIANPELGAKLFKEFGRVFGCSPINLILQPEKFFVRKEKVLVETHKGESFEIDFKDAYEAAQTFQSIDGIRKELFGSVEQISKTIKARIRETIEVKPLRQELDFDNVEINLSPFEKEILKNLWCFIIKSQPAGAQSFTVNVPKAELEKIIRSARAVLKGVNRPYHQMIFFIEENFCHVAAVNGISLDLENSTDPNGVAFKFDTNEKYEFKAASREIRIRRRILEPLHWDVAEKMLWGEDIEKEAILAEEIGKRIRSWIEKKGDLEVELEQVCVELGLDSSRFDFDKIMDRVIEKAYQACDVKMTYQIERKTFSRGGSSEKAKICIEFPPEERLLQNEMASQTTRALLSIDFEDYEVSSLWRRILDQTSLERSTYTGVYDIENIRDNCFDAEWDEDGVVIPIGDVKNLPQLMRSLQAGLKLVGINLKYIVKNGAVSLTAFECGNMPGLTVDGYSPPKEIKVKRAQSGKRFSIPSKLLTQKCDDLSDYLNRVNVEKISAQVPEHEGAFGALWFRLTQEFLDKEAVVLSWKTLEKLFAGLSHDEIIEVLKKFAAGLSNEYIIDELFEEHLTPKVTEDGIAFKRPSEESVKAWAEGRKKCELIKKIKFGDRKKEKLWQAILEEWNFYRWEEAGMYQFVNDFDSSSVYTPNIKIDGETTRKFHELVKDLKAYGIELEILFEGMYDDYNFNINFCNAGAKIADVRAETRLAAAFEGNVPAELLPKVQEALNAQKPGTKKTYNEIIRSAIAAAKYIYDAENNQILVVTGCPITEKGSRLSMTFDDAKKFCKKMKFSLPKAGEYDKWLKEIDVEMKGTEEYYWIEPEEGSTMHGSMGKDWDFDVERGGGSSQATRGVWPVLRIPLKQ